MKNKILLGLSMLPIVLTLILIPFLPDQVPMHYDLNGVADRIGSKWELVVLPVMIVFMTFCWHIYIASSFKRAQTHRFEKVRIEAMENYRSGIVASGAMMGLFSLMHFYFVLIAYTGIPFKMNTVISVLLGIFISVIALLTRKQHEYPILIWAGILIAIQGIVIGGVLSIVLTIVITFAAGIIEIIKDRRV